jgi:hypothetical protein
MGNRPNIEIENKKENMHTDRCGSINGQQYHAKESRQ